MSRRPRPQFVVMGPAGCGKSTVGALLAKRHRLTLLDADDFHSPAAISKMRRGLALTDEDRAPWLARLATALDGATQGAVLCCSALKERYRMALAIRTSDRILVYLAVPRVELARRLRERQGHFANERLLESQLETLEPPGVGETYDGTASPEAIVAEVERRTGLYP